jgi:RND superfamily putative drug exporter
MLRTLAGWCVRHRRLVVLIWFVVLVGASLLGKSVGSAYSNSFQLPHTQSTDAIALLQSAAPKNAGDTENIVVATSGGAKLTDPAIAARVDDLIKKVETLPHVVNITPYASALGAKHINANQTIGFIPVALNQQLNALTQPEGKTFVNAATSTAGGDLHVSVSGQLGELSNPQALGNGTLLGSSWLSSSCFWSSVRCTRPSFR